MFERILVPLDGSKLAERALPHAIQFARIFDSSLTLLRVLDPSTRGDNQPPPEPFHWQMYKAEADVYLKGVASTIRDMGIAIDVALLEGKTPENIIDFAQTNQNNLLIICTHGAGGLSRWNTSSVFRKVIEKIYMPVLVVRAYRSMDQEPDDASEEESSAGGGASSISRSVVNASREVAADLLSVVASDDPRSGQAALEVPGSDAIASPVSYKRILLPIDSSRRAECALPAATALAQSSEAQLLLASVIRQPDLPIPKPYPTDVDQLLDKFRDISRSSINTYLEDIQRRISIETQTLILESDSVIHAIHDLSEQEDIDLVIFCAHGRTGRIELPYGSVSHSYIEFGTRNTLVIQDVPLSQVRPTAAEVASEKYGRR